MAEVTLESLVGEHELSGVDMSEDGIPSKWTNSQPYYGSICRFVLDGKTYTASEDENDGYRSCLGSLVEGGEVTNRFAPQRVLCSMRLGSDETLVMRDMVTGKEVLEIGTDNTDDYYPSFVANFRPDNMAANAR